MYLMLLKSAGSTRNIVVVGFGREQVQAVLGDKAEIVLQEEQLGTGHAVMQAEPLIKDEKYCYNGFMWRYSTCYRCYIEKIL